MHKEHNAEDEQYHEEIILADHGILIFVLLYHLNLYHREPNHDVIRTTLAGDAGHKSWGA